MLLAHVHELTRHGFEPDERIHTLTLTGRFPSVALQERWVALADSPPTPIVSVQVYNVAIQGDLLRTDAFDPDRDISITIVKPEIKGVGLFILEASLSLHLAERAVLPRLAVAELSERQSFSARGLEIVSWDLPAVPPPCDAVERSVDPTPYVRDFVPQREIVTDLSPWILFAEPPVRSTAFAAWEAVAARRLAGGLVSRAWIEDGQVWLQASGPPIFRIRADDARLPAERAKLTEAAKWVFLSGQDIEARHLIFAGELARASGSGQDLAAILDRGVEAAKVTYEAHVQSSSRETLKTLADLRKTVIDETQKVAQRAQDLTAMLWRDLAVSAAPFVLKILGDASKVTGPKTSALFYFAAGAFVAMSFILQWRINEAYFESQTTSRQRWMRTLYPYISEREREEIAEAPIDRAMKNYRETRCTLAVVYALLVVALGYFGIITLNQPPASPPASLGIPATPPPAVQPPNTAPQ